MAGSRTAVPPRIAAPEQVVGATDDKERLIGLFAGPCAAAIGFVVVEALIAEDPPARLAGGVLDARHVPVSLYHDVLYVLLGLALAMVGSAFWRRRIPLGIATGLYGVAVFNLHYWGFGVPFVLVGAWYLVRAYRLQHELRAAGGDPSLGPALAAPSGRDRSRRGPSASARYAPPRSSS